MNQYAHEKCKGCRYRAAIPDMNNCDHILLTGRRRGCSVEDCEKWKEEGDKMPMPSITHCDTL